MRSLIFFLFFRIISNSVQFAAYLYFSKKLYMKVLYKIIKFSSILIGVTLKVINNLQFKSVLVVLIIISKITSVNI
jgi:hypothetical protein